MKKVKLPRKRKKAYIKAKGKGEYLAMRLLIEMLLGEGRGNNRFYSYREAITDKEFRSGRNGYVIAKRW